MGLSADDLWKLHVEVGEALVVKLVAEKDVLEERLRQLKAKPSLERRIATSERWQYPPVFPIQMTRRKRGPGAASSHGGRNSGREKRWTIFESRWPRSSVAARLASKKQKNARRRPSVEEAGCVKAAQPETYRAWASRRLQPGELAL